MTHAQSKKKHVFKSANHGGVMHIQRVTFFVSDNNQAAWETARFRTNETQQAYALNG